MFIFPIGLAGLLFGRTVDRATEMRTPPDETIDEYFERERLKREPWTVPKAAPKPATSGSFEPLKDRDGRFVLTLPK